MDQITCDRCGKEVGDDDETCPHCGEITDYKARKLSDVSSDGFEGDGPEDD